MAPTTLRLVHPISEEHLEQVMTTMRQLGAPTIPVVDCGDYYMALDGSHRATAAARSGIAPELDVWPAEKLVTADDLSTDFFEGEKIAGWIAEQFCGPHNPVLDINSDGTLTPREPPKRQEEE
jgi:hypothetical protein